MILPPEIGRAGLRLMVSLAVMAALVLLLTRPATDSPGFVITVVLLIVAGVAAAAVFTVTRLTNRHLRDLDTTERKSR